MVSRHFRYLIGLVLLALPSLQQSNCRGAETTATALVDYSQDIRPILSDKCFACHGPDEASREAELRLDLLSEALKETTAGTGAIVPGDPDSSEVYLRISSDEDYERMPPVDSEKKLTDSEIELIRRWIEQGAPWEDHWAFVTPQRPDVPEVQDPQSISNAIDHFILAKLEAQGWQMNPPAKKEVLLRRVTFDLTGLPPSLEELEDFLLDDSEHAYKRVVERLLASPHYGEHRARFWLDASRYGDTHGLHLDNYREMWPYRDWVIEAFNSNMPFNQFGLEQLAGDLLPDPSLDQLIATGFNRSHVTTNEGGSIEEEVYVRNVVDRVSTTGTVFMGLTLGCAVCHDHKFDPFSRLDFYQLFAFFNSLDGSPLDGNVKDPAPAISVPSEEQAIVLNELRKEISELRATRDALQADTDPEFTAWLKERVRRIQAKEPDDELDVTEGLVVHCDFESVDDQSVANLANLDIRGRVEGDVSATDGVIGQGIELGEHGFVDLGKVADFEDDEPFSMGAWIRTSNRSDSSIIAKTNPHDLYRGYELTVVDGHATVQIHRKRPGNIIKVVTKKQPITLNNWHHVFFTYDGSQRASGVVLYVDGVAQEVDVHADSLYLKPGIRNSNPLYLGRRDDESGFPGGCLDDVRIYDCQLTDVDILGVYYAPQVQSIRHSSPKDWSEEQLAAAKHFYMLYNHEEFQDCTSKLSEMVGAVRREELKVPTTLIFRERKNPRKAYLLKRGLYDQPGQQVERKTPAALPPMPEDLPLDRLGLAKWLFSPEHPLTSRVTVNRLWQEFFGIGLVETAEDFGSQGTVPSHPKLLDWMAVEIRESGWDVKALIKLIVTSSTYRQSSVTTPEIISRDPQNRLLARGPRYRLDAEMLRDQALYVSGLLVTDIGGPSVKPPQPEGLWQAVGYSGSNTVRFIPDVEHEKIHRRSLYTFHKRTSPPPLMSTFDAPSRESTCVRRERTNTPLQALLLLNDPQFFEAAQSLAQRVMASVESTPEERVIAMIRRCTARFPPDRVMEELTRFYHQQLSTFQANQAAAREVLGQHALNEDLSLADQAAWTIVANLVLNLDEVITKN